MVIGPGTSNDAKAEHHDEIDRLLRAAFGGPDEAGLVRRLRADGDMWCERVKPAKGRIAGYYALSRMIAPVGWACLAPVAVWPPFQGGALANTNSHLGSGASGAQTCRKPWHIGSQMMQELAAVMQMDPDATSCPQTIVVLGKPSFYERAGFSRDRARNLTSPYPIEHTMILRQGGDAPTGTLTYPKAFQTLG